MRALTALAIFGVSLAPTASAALSDAPRSAALQPTAEMIFSAVAAADATITKICASCNEPHSHEEFHS